MPCGQVIIERAAAVVGNLSSTQDFFPAIREAGTTQRLVDLLEAGPQSRVTEIAAKTLSNLAVHESNQTAIRLSGGIPPLMRLLTLKPTDQVRLWMWLFMGGDLPCHCNDRRKQILEIFGEGLIWRWPSCNNHPSTSIGMDRISAVAICPCNMLHHLSLVWLIFLGFSQQFPSENCADLRA